MIDSVAFLSLLSGRQRVEREIVTAQGDSPPLLLRAARNAISTWTRTNHTLQSPSLHSLIITLIAFLAYLPTERKIFAFKEQGEEIGSTSRWRTQRFLSHHELPALTPADRAGLFTLTLPGRPGSINLRFDFSCQRRPNYPGLQTFRQVTDRADRRPSSGPIRRVNPFNTTIPNMSKAPLKKSDWERQLSSINVAKE